MKISSRDIPNYNKIFDTWRNNYRKSFTFSSYLKSKYNVIITLSFWEDEYLEFESEEDYFLFLMSIP